MLCSNKIALLYSNNGWMEFMLKFDASYNNISIPRQYVNLISIYEALSLFHLNFNILTPCNRCSSKALEGW